MSMQQQKVIGWFVLLLVDGFYCITASIVGFHAGVSLTWAMFALVGGVVVGSIMWLLTAKLRRGEFAE